MSGKVGEASGAADQTKVIGTELPRDDASAYFRGPKPLRADRSLQVGPTVRFWVLAGTGFTAAGAAAWFILFGLVLPSEPFRLDPELERLEIRGTVVIEREEVAGLFMENAGRSLASLDPDARLEALRSFPWVRTARVARRWPDSATVTIEERRPVAFLRESATGVIRMIDSDGVILDLRGAAAHSLPVLSGVTDDMPIAERRKRVDLFENVMKAFGVRNRQIGRSVSEIDVSDARNAVVLARHGDRMITLQMGDRHLTHRLDVYLNYIDNWTSKYGLLRAVDLRFEKLVAIQPIKIAEEPG